MLLSAFRLFGLGHCLALVLTVAVPLALIAWSRRGGPAQRIACVFSLLLVANKILVAAMAHRAGKLSWSNGLPMHLCDWATVAVVLALWSRNQRCFELAYFWGLAGTLQAVLTPDLPFDFSDFGAWTFFVSHSGVIAGAIFLVGAFRLRPWPRSVLRAFGWSQVYLAAAAAVDWLAGANYGYLRAKPERPSLLDYLGPWPLYILSLEALALVFYLLFYTPFFVADRLRGRRSAAF